jgi:glycosyltransferase involved in cell wall biosynthesis
MRIGIYVETAKAEQPSGIGLHVRNLIHALAEVDGRHDYFLYYPRGLREVAGSFPHQPKRPNFHCRPVRFPAGWQEEHPSLWWKWFLPFIVRRDRIDVFHGPNHFLPAWDGEKSVVTIHDVAYFKMQVHDEGETNMLKDWTRFALDRAGAVIALSEHTRQDLVTLGVDPARIRVIYGGANVLTEEEAGPDRAGEVKKALGLPDRFILFVGTLGPRKNVPFLLRAFAELKTRGVLRQSLVLAGQRGSAAPEIDRMIQELGLSADVLVTGYVEAWQLPWIYKLADLFVLPTLYEGFGMPLLEAMLYGVPVIATDTSSIREVVGDAGLLVGVNDTDALARAMLSALTDEHLRQNVIAKGRIQAQKFTWQQNARDTLLLYEELHKRSQHQVGPNGRPAPPSAPPTGPAAERTRR